MKKDKDILDMDKDGVKPAGNRTERPPAPSAGDSPSPDAAPTPAPPTGAELVEKIGKAGSESLLDSKRAVRVREFKLRPVNLASIELMRTINSPLILGVKVADPRSLLGDVLEFIMLHTLTEEDAIDHVFLTAEQRRRAVLKWSMNIEIGDTEALVNDTIGVLAGATSTQVKGQPPAYAKGGADSSVDAVMGKKSGNE